MDPLKLLSPSYLFQVTPGADFMYFWPCLAFFLVLIAGGFVAKYLIKNSENKKTLKFVFRNTTMNFVLTGAFGLAALFFRDQNMPYLALRPILAIIIITGLYLIGKTAYLYFKVLPVSLQKKTQAKEMKKYMPKAKR
ncbi:MAG: hypothetical protein ACD_65C00118G0002 [uncultured bacterium]|nr:MAG: hypothetical protein ACD_65C00118G0002 [uncultured bacterium]KKT02369.1 MAG: hypothetical protein UV80_C0004G0058 [Candidatus Peregrinibacteria bacterium GW2011_GWF2_43_17]KKT20290.1 MAG: hypothetical protein UW03_C0006G0025 [Candidatus Peregrinibacteria bacterium GW2011_GWA2_43_8]HAU39453.1 hypothetical protein [Candidatus Peregrinibacteria bacterium]